MNSTKISVAACAIIFIAACHSTKKSAATPSPAPNAPVAVSTSSPAPSNNGQQTISYDMHLPASNPMHTVGDSELAAVQAYYKNTTLEELKEGQEIYTQGACTKCHAPVDVYKIAAVNWGPIFADMAQRAFLTDANKLAVNKYYVAVKATQPK